MKTKTEISAGGIVFKKEKDKIVWLTTQHSQHKGWGFPKGLVGDEQESETSQEAALREVREEAGIAARIVDNSPIQTDYTYSSKDTLVKKTVHYFLMHYVSGDIANHDWEVSDIKFVTEDEVRKTLTYKSDKQAFEKALEKYRISLNK